MVLKKYRVGAPSGSRANSSPSAVSMGLPSRGVGAYCTRSFSSSSVPRPVMAQPQNTGNSERL